MLNLVWLRADLRVYDNPALFQAMAKGDTLAVYCLADQQWDKHGLAPIQRRLIVDHLIELEEQLAKLNVPLLIIDCKTFANIPAALHTLCEQYPITSLYYNHQYEVNEQACTQKTTALLANINVTAYGYHDQCIIAPGEIVNGSRQCYKVFTAFANNWRANLASLARPLYSIPKAQSELSIVSDITSDISSLKNYLIEVLPEINISESWPIGEDEAHDRLNLFIEDDVHDYHNTRDFPDLNATSQLSVYLALGVLTTRQCLQALLGSRMLGQSANGLAIESLDSLNQGELCWLNELVWREFYRNILLAFPRVCKGKPFNELTEKLPWKQNNQAFEAWCQGRTGIPIVDAAMRQLNTTGWMHNRLRMIVAMFLTKHLRVDWRLGEAYFYSKLADADFASNNGGWQWSASTGVDAVPYFRIFNPYRQTERFDPKGDFIRKYVKELDGITGKAIYQPSLALAAQRNYPEPIVNLKEAATETKALFKSLKS